MMNRKLLAGAVLAAALGLGACDHQLIVSNPNSGGTEKVLGTPDDAEALIGSYYKRWSTGLYGSQTELQAMANNLAMMNYSSLANACQNSHLPFTGAQNANAPGNVCEGEQSRAYFYMSEVNRVAATFLGQMDNGLTLGVNGETARDARARSWANFVNGIALGYLAMIYDSAAVIVPGMGPLEAGTLVSYQVVADSAYAALQRAIDAANAPVTGADGFPLPGDWLPSPTSMTAANFVKVVRSYRARIRANVARTPAERAAVDWAAVIADAAGGITSDHLITTSTTVGPTNYYRAQYDNAGLWHQMPAFFFGMADTSGTYATWIATPVASRGAGSQGFFMATPDLRFPQGATRAAQQADFSITSCAGAAQVCKRYFVNRPTANDQNTGDGWGLSNYDVARFHSWHRKGDAGQGQNGDTPFIVFPEIDLLRAEGLYRTGNFAAAGAIVNKTRTANGLPAITTFDGDANLTGGVGGGTAVPGTATTCIPKMPHPDGTVTCGDLWEALKYEKNIETAYTAYANWYFDHRGWGDLAKDIPLFWAVPYQDLQARGTTLANIYGAGPGAGNAANSTAAGSAYGW